MNCEKHQDMQDQIKEINYKIEALRERVNEVEKINLAQSKDFERVFLEITKMEDMQKEILLAVRGLESQSGRKYDKLKEQLVYVLIGGGLSVVGYIASMLIGRAL